MIKDVAIEFLKTKRSKSFFLTFLVIGITLLWMMAILTKYSSISQYHDMRIIYYGVLDVETLMLPIFLSVFVARIFEIERSGNALKLMAINGQSVTNIFWSKLFLTMIVGGIFSLLESLVMLLVAKMGQLSWSIKELLFKNLINLSFIFVLVCVFLMVSLFIKKQELVIASGFIGGFIGFMLHRSSFISLIIPFGGIRYLSLVNMKVVAGKVILEMNQQIVFHFLIYIIYMIVLYSLLRYLLNMKGKKIE